MINLYIFDIKVVEISWILVKTKEGTFPYRKFLHF